MARSIERLGERGTPWVIVNERYFLGHGHILVHMDDPTRDSAKWRHLGTLAGVNRNDQQVGR
jgi:hypothetical protein